MTWRNQTGQSNVKTDEDLFHNQLFKTIYESENVLITVYNSGCFGICFITLNKQL